MQRRLVPVAVAILALAAFAIVAGSLDTVATDAPSLESPDESLDDVDRRAPPPPMSRATRRPGVLGRGRERCG